MNVFISFASMAAVAFAIAPSTAGAQSLRCKSDLVSVGDSRASVLVKCGEPVVKDAFCKPVEAPLGGAPGIAVVVPCESVDEWTYNPGYGQFMTTLRFESGKLVAIKYGDRVTKQ
jgi:hypothetical protein